MYFVCVVYLMIPLLAGPAVPPEISAASADVNARMKMAVAAAVDYEPAWEIDLRSELADSPVYAQRMVDAVYSASQQSGLDPAVLWSVAYTETRGRHRDNQGRVKRGGDREIGLMQIQPFWARALKREYNLDLDLFKLEDNLLASTFILKRGGTDLNTMLSYYNTGRRLKSSSYQRRVMKYLDRMN